MSKETEEVETKRKSNEILQLENELKIARKNILLAISDSIKWIANIQVIKTGLYRHTCIPPNYYTITINALEYATKVSEKLIKICRKLKRLKS